MPSEFLSRSPDLPSRQSTRRSADTRVTGTGRVRDARVPLPAQDDVDLTTHHLIGEAPFSTQAGGAKVRRRASVGLLASGAQGLLEGVHAARVHARITRRYESGSLPVQGAVVR